MIKTKEKESQKADKDTSKRKARIRKEQAENRRKGGIENTITSWLGTKVK